MNINLNKLLKKEIAKKDSFPREEFDTHKYAHIVGRVSMLTELIEKEDKRQPKTAPKPNPKPNR